MNFNHFWYQPFLIFFLYFSLISTAVANEENINNDISENIKKIEERINELKKKLPDPKTEKIPISDEERHKALISAVDNEYSLRSPGVVGVDYTFEYKGKDYDSVLRAEEGGTNIERESTHTIINKVTIEYPLKKNLAFLMEIPFVSIYDDTQGEDTDMDDFGDPYLGVLCQIIKEGDRHPAAILSTGISAPMGRSPYEINPQTEFPTGDGVYSINAGINLSKKINPVLLYGDLFYSYKLSKDNLTYKNTITLGESGEQLEKVKPGDEYGFNIGMGYVISYNVLANLSYKLTYKTPTNYYWRARKKRSSPSSTTSIFILGTAWQITDKRKIYMDIGLGLTNNDEDFYFKFRVPFNFIL